EAPRTDGDPLQPSVLGRRPVDRSPHHPLPARDASPRDTEAITLELPNKSVQIRVNERDRPLAPHERQALASIEDPRLRQIIAETIHAARCDQQNIERIAMQFPIQPENAANATKIPISASGDLLTGDEDGVGAILGVGEDGQVLMADSSEPLGLKWA